MTQTKTLVIDGEYVEVPENARLSDVVGPETNSVLTYDGIIERSSFNAVMLPEGFERQLAHIQKG